MKSRLESPLMSRTLLSLLFAAILFTLPLLSEDRPNLSGTWELTTGEGQLPSSKGVSLTWIIVQDDAKIHITETALREDGKEKKTDISCTTDGKECVRDGKDQPAKVSFWYNGPMLVEMDFGGRSRESVVKKRMRLRNGGAQMLVEIISLVGAEESRNLVFEKR